MTAADVLGRAGGAATGAVLATVSGLRRSKAVHPRGVVREATLAITPTAAAPAGSTLLSTAAEHRALVRFSRSLGLPHPLPDLLGMAVRVIDAYGAGRHQDFLLITTIDAPVLHHLFVPAAHVRQRPYTSSLPYAAGDERLLVGALPEGDDFALAVAPLSGRFAPVGRLRLGATLPAGANALRFNVRENTGGGLEPAGVLNRMRDVAYPMSQWAWRHVGSGAARLTAPVPGA
jgi:hypothetical protein